MTTIILNKTNGTYVYDDYYLGRAALRITELSTDNPVQQISRSKTMPEMDAVLVKKEWYDVKSPASPLPIEVTEITDDYFGSNLSNLANILNGRPETIALTRKIVNEGPAQTYYKVFSIIKTKEFYQDASVVVPFEESSKIGGVIVAYLINPNLYTAIA